MGAGRLRHSVSGSRARIPAVGDMALVANRRHLGSFDNCRYGRDDNYQHRATGNIDAANNLRPQTSKAVMRRILGG